jgi:hypothetical protein
MCRGFAAALLFVLALLPVGMKQNAQVSRVVFTRLQ